MLHFNLKEIVKSLCNYKNCSYGKCRMDKNFQVGSFLSNCVLHEYSIGSKNTAYFGLEHNQHMVSWIKTLNAQTWILMFCQGIKTSFLWIKQVWIYLGSPEPTNPPLDLHIKHEMFQFVYHLFYLTLLRGYLCLWQKSRPGAADSRHGVPVLVNPWQRTLAVLERDGVDDLLMVKLFK